MNTQRQSYSLERWLTGGAAYTTVWSNRDLYAVVDKFGEGQTVAEYAIEQHAHEAAANISRLTGHETAVYIGDRRLVTFAGRTQ